MLRAEREAATRTAARMLRGPSGLSSSPERMAAVKQTGLWPSRERSRK